MDTYGAVDLQKIIDAGIRGEHRHYFDEEIEEMAFIAGQLRAGMTIGVLPNPTGAGYFDTLSYGNYHMSAEILSSASGGPFVLGTLMEVVTPYTGPGTTNPQAVVTVQPSSTTADSLLIGPMTQGGDGRSANAATSVAAGKLAVMLRLGIAQICCDATTTAGGQLIQSAAHAGNAKTGTAVTGQTIGTALQAVTIAAANTLVWADICKT